VNPFLSVQNSDNLQAHQFGKYFTEKQQR